MAVQMREMWKHVEATFKVSQQAASKSAGPTSDTASPGACDAKAVAKRNYDDEVAKWNGKIAKADEILASNINVPKLAPLIGYYRNVRGQADQWVKAGDYAAARKALGEKIGPSADGLVKAAGPFMAPKAPPKKDSPDAPIGKAPEPTAKGDAEQPSENNGTGVDEKSAGAGESASETHSDFGDGPGSGGPAPVPHEKPEPKKDPEKPEILKDPEAEVSDMIVYVWLDGKPVIGADVVIRHKGARDSFLRRTKDEGYAVFFALPTGRYTVYAQKGETNGFADTTVQVDESASVNIHLRFSEQLKEDNKKKQKQDDDKAVLKAEIDKAVAMMEEARKAAIGQGNALDQRLKASPNANVQPIHAKGQSEFAWAENARKGALSAQDYAKIPQALGAAAAYMKAKETWTTGIHQL